MNNTEDVSRLLSEVEDIARRIGPARLPESVRAELEEVVSRYRRWNRIEAKKE